MKGAGIGLALLLAIAGGCDRGGRIDASGDSGVDAGQDAALDAGFEPLDAEVDGGTPDPLIMALTDARDDVADAETAQAALDPSVAMDVRFIQLDMVQARVDAVIGEKISSLIAAAGVIGEKSTLAFELPVAATVVVLRQLRQAQLDLTAIAGALDPIDPMVGPLHTALVAEAESLGMLREKMLVYYDDLLVLAAALPGTEDPSYVDRRSIHTMPESTYVDAILEGSATDTDGSVTVMCARGITAPLTVTVRDDRALDPPLVTGSGQGPHAFLLRADQPTLLRVELTLTGVPHDVCEVQVQGRRHFRGPANVLDSTAIDDLGTRRIDWDSRMSTLTGTVAMMRSEGDANDQVLADIVEAYLREASSESGSWRSGLTSISPEDHDVLSLTLDSVVIPLSEVLEARLATSTSRFADSVATLVAELRAHNEAALVILTPAP